MNVFAAEDFPRLPAVDVPLHEIEAVSLLDTVQRVSRAASRDESRPVLTGILVRFEGSKLTMAATDSYRMAVKETELSWHSLPCDSNGNRWQPVATVRRYFKPFSSVRRDEPLPPVAPPLFHDCPSQSAENEHFDAGLRARALSPRRGSLIVRDQSLSAGRRPGDAKRRRGID